ncbi:MAG: ABC transporter ATP-binding protein [Candidatus Latescibacterota bacterium]|jgi:lipoprotein-releasing system ATP-binding protein|nr:ABC transporter ATP-binding protein [Candidatus Latescibacterota bacterium]
MLTARRLGKVFGPQDAPLEILRDVSFEVPAGQSLAITGPSGSGKSTLLHILGSLDTPSSGGVEIDSIDPFALPELELARFRNTVVGFVFQDHHLLPQHSLLENVLIPALAFGRPEPAVVVRARELLDRVGLSHRLDHRPGQLSGGECQRTALARGLLHQPKLLLCDEPTGSLDRRTAQSVADLLFELHAAEGNVMVIVTHHGELAGRCDRSIELRDMSCRRDELT